MASSGQVYTNKYDGIRGLMLSWSIDSQSIPSNSTTIRWNLSGYGDRPGKYYVSSNFKVYVNGKNVYSSNSKVNLYASTHVASGTHTIYHNSDGTSSVSIEISGGVYAWSITNVSGSDSWSLPTIPRKATIKDAPNFTDEDNPTIYYENLAGNAVDSVQAAITQEDGSTGIAFYRTISKTGTSYTFNLSSSEKSNIWNYCKDHGSRTVYFYVKTFINGEPHWSSITRTVSIIDGEPVINPTVVDSNPKTVALTGDERKLIKHASIAKYSANAHASKGATITSLTVDCGGTRLTTQDGEFKDVLSGRFVFTVVDSRGMSATAVIDRTIYDYEYPTAHVKSGTMSPEGKIDLSFGGKLYAGDFNGTTNERYAWYKYRQVGGSYTDWISVSNRIVATNSRYNVSVIFPEPPAILDYTKEYEVEVMVQDSIATARDGPYRIIAIPVYAVGKDKLYIMANTIVGPVRSIGAIPPSRHIPKYSDLNSYVVPGVYCVRSNYDAATIRNSPTSYAFKLTVSATLGDKLTGDPWQYITQEIEPYSGNLPLYVRTGKTESAPGEWLFEKWYSILKS